MSEFRVEAISNKDGSFNISEIPLGQYVVIVEFIGYSKKEIGPLRIFPGKMVGGEGKIKHFLGEIPLKISNINWLKKKITYSSYPINWRINALKKKKSTICYDILIS